MDSMKVKGVEDVEDKHPSHGILFSKESLVLNTNSKQYATTTTTTTTGTTIPFNKEVAQSASLYGMQAS